MITRLTSLTFENIRVLGYIPLLVIVLSLLIFCSLHYQKKIKSWISPRFWPSIIPEFSEKTFKYKNLVLSFLIVFLCFALARPQWGEKEEVIKTQGMDIFFLLDLSNSMLAEDASPSRLSRAQTFIKKTLSLLTQDRVGIIGFAGSAQLSIPLTTDFQYINEIVDTLDPNSMTNQGTNIGSAIDSATRALERSGEDEHKNTRALILITDGEDFGEGALEATKKIKAFGTEFFAISVGSTDGAPIPVRDDAGVLQTYKKDTQGKPILSRVNKELLSKIASEANGKYLELINPDDTAYSLNKQLKKSSLNGQKEQRQVTKIERFEWPLCVAVFLFFLYLGMGYRKFDFKKIFLFVFLFFSSTTFATETSSIKGYFKNRAGASSYDQKKFEESSQSFSEAQSIDSENPSLYYNEGTALANQDGKTEDALQRLQTATQKSLISGDFSTAAKSLYNEGLIHAQGKKMPEAYDRLTKAIEISKISNQPDIEKKAREELAQLAIQQQQEQKQNGDKGDKKENKNEDKKKQDENKGNEQKNDQQNKGNPQNVAEKREFKSGTLSKDTAESIMNDLSDREKQLYHHRLKDQKRKEPPHGNDW